DRREGLGAPSRPPPASDRCAAWLDDVWRELGVTPAPVVGVSLVGGWLALNLAVRRPQNVASLVLLSPSGIGRTHELTMVRLGLLRTCGHAEAARSFAIVAGRKMPAALMNAMTVFTHFRPRLERIPIRTDEELAALRMPVLAVVGGRDALLRSGETRDRLTPLVPGARVAYLEQEGHILPPQATAIADFLAADAAITHP